MTSEKEKVLEMVASGKVTAEEAAANLIAVMEGLRPDQSGGFFDYAGKEIVW